MSRIGRYRIESEIGRGTMGVVYLAHDPRLERRVAIKTYALPQGISKNDRDEYHERFLREARAAARLSHRGIVTVYDAGTDPRREVPFIAMEFVPGTTLHRILHDGVPLSLERAVSITVGLAEALGAAHDAGIIHRDVKPSNVLVREPDGAIKLVDFGVARLPTSTLTRDGTPVGSPAYMSPEQVRGGTVDGRSDLFSLAATFYEMLCGKRPFEGNESSAVLYAVVHESPIPITKRRADLPSNLDRFFDRALAKNPADRFQDAASFRQALEEACRAAGSPDPAATVLDVSNRPRSPRRKIRFVAVGVTLTLLLGWFVFWVNRGAYLKLDAKSGVESGRLTVMVDGEEVYERPLSAPRKDGFFKKLLEKNVETFEALVKVPAGRHEVVAHVVTTDAPTPYQDSIVIDLEPGETRTLKVSAGRMFGEALSLKSD